MYVDELKLALGQRDDVLLAFFHAQRTGGSAFVRWLKSVLGTTAVYDYRNVDPFIHWVRSNRQL